MKQARKDELTQLLLKTAAVLKKTAAQKPRFTVDLRAVKKLVGEAKNGK